jgi:SAM-dependent methyltransferase
MSSAMEERVFKSIYRRAKSPGELPWAKGSPEVLLNQAMQAQRAEPGGPRRALDVGCGAGPYSVVMARAGYDVTGLDFMPAALAMAERTASEAGVRVHFVQGDATRWQAPAPFDLVLDCGCLHGFDEADRPRYKARLLEWLKPGGHFVLGHFGKRHPLDWRPMGPKRWKRERVLDLLGDALTLREDREEVIHGVRLPVGPTVLLRTYWFQRPER